MEQHDQPPAGRKAPTPASWKPGTSGNPRGRPRKGSALTDAIRDQVDTTELVSIALDLARNGEAESTRLGALAWLRDSGYTRPAERHEVVTGAPQEEDDAMLEGLSIEQLRELHAAELEHEARRAAIMSRPVLAVHGVPANHQLASGSASENDVAASNVPPVVTPLASRNP